MTCQGQHGGKLRPKPAAADYVDAQHVTYLLNPVSCRWAIVLLRGRSEPYWYGHYGCKFAGPQLTFGLINSFT